MTTPVSTPRSGSQFSLMNRYINGIEATENEVASTILENHSRELEIVCAALDQILRGFNEFADHKERPDNKLESARVFLTTRSFNSLRVAMKVLERVYTQQALTLIRTVMEDQLVAGDAENHPPTLDALFSEENRLGKGKFTFGKMAIRLSPKAKMAWDSNYGFVSSFAAHPRHLSIRKLLAVDTDGKITLMPGPRYDRVEVYTAIFYTLGELMKVMATMAKLTYSVGSNWANDAMFVIEEVNSLFWHIDEEAKKELEELATTGGSPEDRGGG